MILPLRILEKRYAGAWSEFLRFRSRNCWRNDIRNFAGWVCFRKEKPARPRLAFDVMFGTWGKSVRAWWLGAFAAGAFARADGAASEFRCDLDTFGFPYSTVFESPGGHSSLPKWVT